MPTIRSKYSENQILSATVRNFALMSELLSDTLPRAAAAAAANAAFATVFANLNAASTAWDAGESAVTNAEAGLRSTTLGFEDKMAALTRQPDAETSSLLEAWDTTIRTQVAYRSPIYLGLLPHGRKALTAGHYEQRLDSLRAFGTRLSAQSTKPALVSLGNTVTTFSNAVRTLRQNQLAAKATLDTARTNQEFHRIAAANAIYALIGQGMVTFNATPRQVDTLWDVNLLRPSRKKAPARPKKSAEPPPPDA